MPSMGRALAEPLARWVAVLGATAGLGVMGVLAQSTRGEPVKIEPKGSITLAWHTNITARWLDPQQHDGTAFS